MTAYYNEIEPAAAAWLRQLIAGGHIAPGDVDERSIVDVRPNDLRGYSQCHFFAGIGGWSYALRLAGWPDDRPAWTGSCPCQPFSAAGKQGGTSDQRHLWPHFIRLIRACRPDIVFGEQVSGRSGLIWLDGEGAYMQDMQDRSAVLGVLRQLKGQSPEFLQGLRDCGGTGAQTVGPGCGFGKVQDLAIAEARIRTGERSQEQGENSRIAVRSGWGRDSSSDRCRHLSDDRNSVRPVGTESVECPISGSDNSRGGIYEGECSCGFVCVECDGEYMGDSEDFADCVGDFGSTEGAERALCELDRREAETSDDGSRFASVRFQLEECDYTVGALDLPAASVGAPHRRQRLYWVGMADASERRRIEQCANDNGSEQMGQRPQASERAHADGRGEVCWVGDTRREGSQGRVGPGDVALHGDSGQVRPVAEAGLSGPWSDILWLPCSDGKSRPTKPGVRPLVAGLPRGVVRGSDTSAPIDANNTPEARVMRLRGYGNAIVPAVAAAFLTAAIT